MKKIKNDLGDTTSILYDYIYDWLSPKQVKTSVNADAPKKHGKMGFPEDNTAPYDRIII